MSFELEMETSQRKGRCGRRVIPVLLSAMFSIFASVGWFLVHFPRYCRHRKGSLSTCLFRSLHLLLIVKTGIQRIGNMKRHLGGVANIVVLGMAYLVVEKEESGENNESEYVRVDMSLTLRLVRWVFFIWADEL